MKNITFKYGVLPLAIALTLTGCQEAEIQGTWTGPKESLNKETIASLFTASTKEFDGEKIVVSALRNEAGVQVFDVSFKGEEFTQASLHTVLDNVKKYQSSFTTQLTVEFINPEPNNTRDKKDSLPQLLANAGIKKEGSETTDMLWAKTDINVFTLKASKNASRSPQHFGMAIKNLLQRQRAFKKQAP